MQLGKCKGEAWDVGPGRKPRDRFALEGERLLPECSEGGSSLSARRFLTRVTAATPVWEAEKHCFGLQSRTAACVCINGFYWYLEP